MKHFSLLEIRDNGPAQSVWKNSSPVCNQCPAAPTSEAARRSPRPQRPPSNQVPVSYLSPPAARILPSHSQSTPASYPCQT